MRNMLYLSGIFVCLGRLIKFFSPAGHKILVSFGLLGGIITQADTMYSLCYAITCIVVCRNLLPLVVFAYPLIVLAFPLAILFCPLAVLACPLVVLVCPLVVSVCSLVVLVVYNCWSFYHWSCNSQIKSNEFYFILNCSKIIENNYKLMIHVYNSL